MISDGVAVLTRRNPVNSHIRPQRFGNYDRTIRLLIILDDSYPGAAHSQAGAVQRVDKLTFPAALRLEADSGAARLKRFAIRAGGNLAEFIARGKPDFDVVSLGGGEAHVAGAEQHGAVVQAELLQNHFGVAGQRLVFFVASFRVREFE